MFNYEQQIQVQVDELMAAPDSSLSVEERTLRKDSKPGFYRNLAKSSLQLYYLIRDEHISIKSKTLGFDEKKPLRRGLGTLLKVLGAMTVERKKD